MAKYGTQWFEPYLNDTFLHQQYEICTEFALLYIFISQLFALFNKLLRRVQNQNDQRPFMKQFNYKLLIQFYWNCFLFLQEHQFCQFVLVLQKKFLQPTRVQAQFNKWVLNLKTGIKYFKEGYYKVLLNLLFNCCYDTKIFICHGERT